MWLSAIKIAAQAGSKIYANRQKAKMAMSEAQLLHAERQARGEEAYQGKLLGIKGTQIFRNGKK
jgi:peptide subunit release factor RF-3